MKCIYEGKVLHMMPIPSGIVAAILSDVTEDGKINLLDAIRIMKLLVK